MKAISIIGGGKKENRVKDDFYPTPPECTHALMKFLHSECDFYFDRSLKIHEPACGNGAISEIIKKYGHDVISQDINTEYGTVKNFLTEMEWTKFDAIITNPPFNLSENFIRISLKRSRIVCMLLKSQYWHAAKRQKLFTEYTPSYICPMTWRPDFSGGGNPTMDCIWTIWIKGNNQAKYIPLTKPNINLITDKDQARLF